MVLNPQLNLHPIEEEREDYGSRAPSIEESEHRTNSNKSGSHEETREDYISIVRLSWVLSPLEVEEEFRFWVSGFGNTNLLIWMLGEMIGR
jgi:hypothetical protein